MKQKAKRKTLKQVIRICLAEMERRIDKGEITSARRADELAAELTGEHYPDPDSSNHEALLAALCEKAGKEFPGDWEDYPK